MNYTNSPLVDFIQISPNKTSPRNHKIDTITIHCTGFVCDVETLGRVFANPDRKASSNYGIGKDGRIGMYCEEKDRSWCSSSKANDHRAITIETCSEHDYPYAVSDTVMASLIKLVADICKRNGIKKLLWKNDKSLIGKVDEQNMTLHRWFAATACPGQYLYERMGNIADAVNSILLPKGDVNGDGSVNIEDMTALLDMISKGEYSEAADINEDGTVDEKDVNALYDILDDDGEYDTVEIELKQLHKGSKGQLVKSLLLLLNYYDNYNLSIDGSFGSKTDKAVRDYQSKHDLKVDGYVGDKTWAMLLTNNIK